jgi:ribosomal 50S subunit-associated protein YjgA (DUF615 family)
MSNLQTFVSSLQRDALEKDALIENLEEELGETKRLLAEAKHELEIVSDVLREEKREEYR